MANNKFGVMVDATRLGSYTKCTEPYIEQTYAGHEGTHMVVFKHDSRGMPGYGWVMKGPNVITFAPTESGKIGIWSGARNDPLPQFASTATVDRHFDRDIEVPRILSMVGRGAGLGKNGRPLVEQAHYIPKTQTADGKARMWMRDRLFGVRFTDGCFSVIAHDGSRIIMSDWVEGKPWECGEEIAAWALEHNLWIDRPKVAVEKREIYAASDAKMQDNPLYGIF